MNNKYLGILIILLYLCNFQICKIIYNGDVDFFWKLKVAIYSLCFLLAIHYKSRNCFTEKLFIAIVINNIFVLIRHSEISYTMNDLIFITSFTAIQYVKQLYRNYSEYIFRNLAIYFNIKKPK
jgi:hypothetical protein